MDSKHFYRNLRTVNLPVADVFQPHHFSEVPSDWFIIMSDVKDSTAAVKSGKHNDVNLIAAGSLIVALNIAKANNVEIPFFFGGDGGTMLVPADLMNEVMTGLILHNTNTIKNFGLEMHIGSVPVKDVIDAGHFVKIAKIKYGTGYNKSIIIGDGLRYAEQLIKGTNENLKDTRENDSELNLTGLECRWDKVKPPGEENEVVCYLIEATDPARQIEVYRSVLKKTDEIYGNVKMRNPLSLDRLRLLFKFDKFKKEMLAKYGGWKINSFVTAFIRTLLGKYYFRYNLKINDLRGKEYLNQVIANADTLTIDGRINTIISGTMDRRIEFLKYLMEEEKKGSLVYGHHISKESVMTCYIENYNDKHIHFVDGSNGGYTEAAKELKKKFNTKL